MYSRLECPVCFEEYDELSRRPQILKVCGHSFCQRCLRDWLNRAETRDSCPMCRSTVKEIRTNDALIELCQKKKLCPPCSCRVSRTHYCPTCHETNYSDWEERLEDGFPTFCVSCSLHHELDTDHRTHLNFQTVVHVDDQFEVELEVEGKVPKPMTSGRKALCTVCAVAGAALFAISSSVAVYCLF